MAIEIGAVNADTSVKIGPTTVQNGCIGYNVFYGNGVPILDIFPSAHHAYSLRKLRTAYGGYCLRIRRTTASPNPVTTTTADLAFDANGTISFSSSIYNQTGTFTNAVNLGQFAQGTVDGLTAHSVINVVTWYDQSGNGKNPTQATTGQQPRLVNVTGGVATLETSGGKVAVRFVKTSTNFLTLTDTTANINNMSSYFVGAFVGSTNGQIGYNLGTTNRFYLPYFNTSIYAAYATSATGITLDSSFSTTRKLYELISPSSLGSSVVEGWTNGDAKGTRPLVSAATANITLGTGAAFYYDGYIQEVIGWQTYVNRLEKEKSINSYWKVF